MSVLRAKLPAAEVEYAVEDALVDAGYKGNPRPLSLVDAVAVLLQHIVACKQNHKAPMHVNSFTTAAIHAQAYVRQHNSFQEAGMGHLHIGNISS